LTEISEATTEAMQIFLIFKDKVIFNKRKIILEIEQDYKKEINGLIIYYKEIVDLEEKVLNGTLTNFTSENINHYKEKAQRIVNYIERTIVK